MKAQFIVAYTEETKKLHGKERKQKSFNEALHEIENDPDLIGGEAEEETNKGHLTQADD